MTFTERWQKLLGVQPDEGRTVWLFFLHNFLLGIGTVQVYVAANVLLLENNPERDLPLAYGVAGLLMLGIGRVYEHFEHHWALRKLAGRVLLAAVALVGVVAVLAVTGHSVASAVAVMAGYRVVYLLTNLEFWGVSAVVFDVRQGRRLFSVISAGDMPAKALGAVLGLLVHSTADLPGLLGLAFVAYLGALLVLRATLAAHPVEAAPARRATRTGGVAEKLRRWFGDSRLVLTLCLALLGLAAVSTGIEYLFFVNVKLRFHDEAAVMHYVGSVLTFTFLLAMVFKLVLSQRTLNRLGVRGALLALPVLMLAALALYLQLNLSEIETRLLYFCGLYLGLEVLRRAVFDPVFLLLFQPLAAGERLHAHTLVKGRYEPLGMALAGALLFGLHQLPGGQSWLPFGWMAALLVAVTFLLLRTYREYVAELHLALGRRFAADEDDAPDDARPADDAPADPNRLVGQLGNKHTRATATRQLLALGDQALPALAAALATEANPALVRRLALVCGRLRTPASRQALLALARQPNLFRREAALQALRYFDEVPADAPLFQDLVQQELRLAQQLLHGQEAAGAALAQGLDYELTRTQQRIFHSLGQLYPPRLIADAQRGVAHATRERQANALEILDNSIARPVYQGLQALLAVASPAAKSQVFEQVLGLLPGDDPIAETVVERGEDAFTDWTVSVALPAWQPTPATITTLAPHLHSASLLVRESAFSVLAQLAAHRAGLYQKVQATHPTLDSLLMSHAAAAPHISAAERVRVLQQTALFAETPANVLSSIVPIMQEARFAAGYQIFAKGDLGASLFIVYEGTVGIFSGPQHLATFGPGDFFGELALLDAEPRSASAVTQSPVTAFRLDQEDFYDVMDERPEVLRNILRVLCQRLRRQNEAGR